MCGCPLRRGGRGSRGMPAGTGLCRLPEASTGRGLTRTCLREQAWMRQAQCVFRRRGGASSRSRGTPSFRGGLARQYPLQTIPYRTFNCRRKREIREILHICEILRFLRQANGLRRSCDSSLSHIPSEGAHRRRPGTGMSQQISYLLTHREKASRDEACVEL